MSADHVVTIDGDGAHDPNDVASLLESHIEGGSSLTVGDRMRSEGLGLNSTKRLVNALAAPIFRNACKLPLPDGDYACGLRIYSRAFAQHILDTAKDLKPFGLCFFSVLEAVQSNWKLAFVPCGVRYDAARLLYTSRTEWADFLCTVIDVADDSEFRKDCQTLLEASNGKDLLRFILHGEVIYGIPTGSEADGYIFQQQNSFFEERHTGECITTLRIR